MGQFFFQVTQLLQRYSGAQRTIMAVIFVGMISVIISLVMWANRPEYDILYAEVEPGNASNIITELQSLKVPYRLENGGRTISVPTDKVSELRVRFTEEGFNGDLVVGYEVFDKDNIGMTTFKQRLNLRRALEGELVRTINQFPNVQQSRVHLAIPESRLFEDKKHGKASVVLYLNPGSYIERSQIKGISSLVANAVDGIDVDGVVIVDSDGSLLSENQSEESVLGTTGSQWDLQNSIEAQYQAKVADILDGVLGPQNSVVKVAVELNFEKVERTSESYDPDNAAILSEESHSTSSTNVDTSLNVNEQQTDENVLTNYELSKTIEHYVSNTGTIERVSVAVLINGSYKKTISQVEGEDDVIVKEYRPRSQEELDQISALVKSAVGYSSDRGDVIEVSNMEFDRSGIEENKNYFEELESQEMWAGIINKGMLAVSLIIAFLVIRTLLAKSTTTFELPLPPGYVLAGGDNTALSGGTIGNAIDGSGAVGSIAKTKKQIEEEEEIDADEFIAKLSPEARAKLKAKDKMTEAVTSYAKESPEGTSKLIRSWMTNSALAGARENG